MTQAATGQAAGKAGQAAIESLEKAAAAQQASSQPAGDEAMLAKLIAAEQQIKELTERLASQEAEAFSGLKISPGDRPYVGENGGYLFEVGPVNKSLHDVLPPIQVSACDESEAKRYYCNKFDYPKGSKRAIDPVAIEINVTCKDPRRQQLIHRKARLAMIRTKLNSGQQLTGEEQKILDENQQEVLGFRF